MNDIAIWKNGSGEYTVIKGSRVYVMNDDPNGKDGYVECICSAKEVDGEWMDKNQERVEFKDLSPDMQRAIERSY
jgi:hypothetical protein